MNGAPQPATDEAGRDRDLPRMRFERKQPAARVVRPDAVTPTPWWVRARAVVLLSTLLALIGALLALLLLLGGALILTGLKNAVE